MKTSPTRVKSCESKTQSSNSGGREESLGVSRQFLPEEAGEKKRLGRRTMGLPLGWEVCQRSAPESETHRAPTIPARGTKKRGGGEPAQHHTSATHNTGVMHNLPPSPPPYLPLPLFSTPTRGRPWALDHRSRTGYIEDIMEELVWYITIMDDDDW